MRYKIASILLILSSVAFGQTIYGDLALPPGAFLWLNTCATQEALGGAGVADGGLKSAGNANPAALFGKENLSVGASYSYMRTQTFNSNIYGAKVFGEWAFAARLFIMDSGEIEARTGPTSEPDYTFTSHQLYLQFSGARRIADIIDLGASAKWIHERIDQDDRDGWVFDLGATGNYKFLHAGVAVQNHGSEVVFRMFRERYPLTYRMGIAAEVLDYGTIHADYIKPDRLGGWFAVGVEGRLTDYAVLRAGYTPGHDTRNISAGFGIRAKGIDLDYAIVNFSEGLGLSHQVTLSYNIGG